MRETAPRRSGNHNHWIAAIHFHADFLSGHLEMAPTTGAWIGYGQGAHAEFQIRSLADGERITLGEVAMEIVHTPRAHTRVHQCAGVEHPDDEIADGVLTGDAQFIGDVGRPDLLDSTDVTADELGHQRYDSIQRKLMGQPSPTVPPVPRKLGQVPNRIFDIAETIDL
jgi:hydroxyacylglutathione hydrolase